MRWYWIILYFDIKNLGFLAFFFKKIFSSRSRGGRTGRATTTFEFALWFHKASKNLANLLANCKLKLTFLGTVDWWILKNNFKKQFREWEQYWEILKTQYFNLHIALNLRLLAGYNQAKACCLFLFCETVAMWTVYFSF